MKKRSRQSANLYKEPSSDLSDLDLSSDDGTSRKRAKRGTGAATQSSKRSKTGVDEESKEPVKVYGKC